MGTTNIFISVCFFFCNAGSQGGCVLSVISQHPSTHLLLMGKSTNHNRVLNIVHELCQYCWMKSLDTICGIKFSCWQEYWQ